MAEQKKKPAEEVEYTQSTAQRDLEERLARGNKVEPIRQGVNPSDQLDEDSAYVGVDPIYQNYASDTEKPYASEEGPEAEAEALYLDAVNGVQPEPIPEVLEAYDKITSGAHGLPKSENAVAGKSESDVKTEPEAPVEVKTDDKTTSTKTATKA